MTTTTTRGATGMVNVLPTNVSAERAILGALLLKPELLADIKAAGLCPKDFSLSAHTEIFDRMLAMMAGNIPLDLITLSERLANRLAAIGGVAYLSDLTIGAIPLKKHILYHATIVMVKARLRHLQNIGATLENAAGQPGADPTELARRAVAALTELTA